MFIYLHHFVEGERGSCGKCLVILGSMLQILSPLPPYHIVYPIIVAFEKTLLLRVINLQIKGQAHLKETIKIPNDRVGLTNTRQPHIWRNPRNKLVSTGHIPIFSL
jgi:hypothetical protein